MFTSATSPLMLCMYRFVLNLFIYYYISFLSARVAADSIKRICAFGWFVFPVGLCFRLVCISGWFVLPVGLYEWKTTIVHLILTIMFKNILGTFEAEILKLFNSV